MNGNNDNEGYALDEFLDETPAQPYLYSNPSQGQPYRYPKDVSMKKKSPVILTLLCGIFITGIAMFAFQIWRSLDNNGSQIPQNQPSYGQPFQNGENAYGNRDNDTYGNHNGGEADGGEQFGQYQADDGTVIQFRINDGRTEYSTDNGKTWSETSPEGMPPLP
ncbi:hypothetical protein IW492_15250 [Enterococcus sp. BWB1-3]|uniref:hypothetical protein n=1 Tax=unclassified Enterococcus TaxID=2608891 RepID=UPI00192415D6|nr:MULTISPECIES: hypothetical protein [unclassified Enterococcus]MBL1230587.1 hypothetical protein [Enterococcus sp. BWB1-3]MCB5950892.1 hypothetical protein [Enterococcus sp. BWT-B8]